MKNRLLEFTGIITGIILFSLGVGLFIFPAETPTIQKFGTNDGAKKTSIDPVVLQSSAENTLRQISSIFKPEQHIRSTQVAKPIPAPSLPTVIPADWFIYVGYITDGSGARHYYFKDSQQNTILKTGKEDPSAPVITSEDAFRFIIQYQGAMYEVKKK